MPSGPQIIINGRTLAIDIRSTPAPLRSYTMIVQEEVAGVWGDVQPVSLSAIYLPQARDDQSQMMNDQNAHGGLPGLLTQLRTHAGAVLTAVAGAGQTAPPVNQSDVYAQQDESIWASILADFQTTQLVNTNDVITVVSK